LSAGLMKLRIRLIEAARALPCFPRSFQEEDNVLKSMQQMVPDSIRPTALERELVGEWPDAWVLLYQNKIMCAGAMRHAHHPSSYEIGEVLVQHGYNSFMSSYLLVVVFLATVLGIVGISFYLVFRLRIFGWFEAPMSLAELIPGSFDPVRLADPDFDPARQKKQLPYRSVLNCIGSRKGCAWERIVVVLKALVGVYSSWFFTFIRIPPEKDSFDEEYLSDDDEDSRLKVREVCRDKAYLVRTIEVFCRAAALSTLFAWLWCCRRLNDAILLGLLVFMHTWLASCVAQSSIPEAEPDGISDEADAPPKDAALAIAGLFGVQHGPRWLRAICAVRSTAAPSKQKQSRQRRQRRKSANLMEKPGHSSGNDGLEASKTSDQPKESRDEEEEDKPVAPAGSGEGGDFIPAPSAPFSDRFQRQMLNSRLLHTLHGSYLELSAWTMVSVFVGVIWLLHVRWLIGDCTFFQHYQRTLPEEFFQVYGGPGTFWRSLAVLGELLLLWFCGEKLCEITCLLNVATLVLNQRLAALRYLREHMPPLAAGIKQVSIGDATAYREESLKCRQFAVELSDARWLVLQKPVSLAIFITQLMFLVSIVLLMLRWSPQHWPRPLDIFDPTVFLVIGLVILSPLVNTLMAAHSANAEDLKQRQRLRLESEDVMAASSSSQEVDVEYVKLRVKLQQALAEKAIAWPNGRELGLGELCRVILVALFAVGLASLQGLNYVIP